MKYRTRVHYSEADKALMWDRWQKGDSLTSIARHFDRNHSTVQAILGKTGGIRPPPRRRSRLALTLSEREEISVWWDDLGIKSTYMPSGTFSGRQLILLQHNTSSELEMKIDDPPKKRFRGSIDFPSGLLELDESVETDGLGFQNMSKDDYVLVKKLGKTVVTLVAMGSTKQTPEFVNILRP